MALEPVTIRLLDLTVGKLPRLRKVTFAHEQADGRVTLRGNVRDAREKDVIESHARDIAGAGNVKNQLDVVD